MRHLSADQLVSVIENGPQADERAHVHECATCREQVESLRLVLEQVRNAPAREPSPLFWTHFSARVHDAIAQEATPVPTRLPAWMRWQLIAPAAALAGVLLLAALFVSRGTGGDSAPVVAERTAPAAEQAIEPVDDLASLGEQDWSLVADIVGDIDLGAVHDAGLVSLGDADRAMLQLNDEERLELRRLVQEEVGKAGGSS